MGDNILKPLGVVAERSEVAVFVLRHHTRMIANQDGSVYSTRCSAAKRSLPRGPMAERFEAYRTRVLSYLGDEEPIGVQQATPSQLDRRLRDAAPEELIRRPAPEKWSIAEIVAHLADAELAMGWRLRNMLANPGVALTWWDQAVWAERLGYAQQDASPVSYTHLGSLDYPGPGAETGRQSRLSWHELLHPRSPKCRALAAG